MFEIGDKVRLAHIGYRADYPDVEKWPLFAYADWIGETFTVRNIDWSGRVQIDWGNGDNAYYGAWRFEKAQKTKFMVGDRVKVSTGAYKGGGKVGKVLECSSELALIEFDVHIDGHDGGGCGRNGHCWWVGLSYVEKETTRTSTTKKSEPKTSEILAVGTRVSVTGTYDGKTFRSTPGTVLDGGSISLGTVLIEFDHFMGGHSGGREGKDGHCWHVPPRMVTVIETTSTTWIISLQKPDGTFAPAETPKTYVSEAQAIRVAKDMADKHGGKFVVFQSIGAAEAPPPVERPTAEFKRAA